MPDCNLSKSVKQSLVTFSFIFICAICVLLTVFDYSTTPSTKSVHQEERFLIDSEHCKIPKVSLQNEALKKLWNKPKYLNCSLNKKLSQLTDDERIIVYGTGGDKECCLREIERPYNMPGDRYHLPTVCTPVLNNTDASDKQFFVVECSLPDNSGLQYNFHSTTFQNTTVVPKLKHWNNIKKSDRPVSIMMIILDSTTRNDAFRSLHSTMDYLIREHNFVDFKGHHILGEPDFSNILPLLMGTTEKDFWGKVKTDWRSSWDPYPFIWTNFSKLNYVTFLSDDEGIFNSKGQQGFTEQPTDYYLRPLMNSHSDAIFSSMSGLQEFCFGKETKTEFLLNYHKKLLLKFQDIPTFSLNRISWPQKENFELLSDFDGVFLKFFESVLGSRVIYETTVIIFMSDHGSTDHSYSSTFEGLLERRMPLLLFHIPKRLAAKNEKFTKNLISNSRTLTSHLDTYETLIHLAKLAKQAVNGKSSLNSTVLDDQPSSSKTSRKSLLDFISPDRTCQEANIPSTICSCNLPSPLNITEFNALHQKIPDNVKLPTQSVFEFPVPIPFTK